MKRSLIFLPVVVLLLLLAAYAGYWLFIASRIEEAARALKEHPADGALAIDFAGLSVGGFPFRIELSATELRIAGADLQFAAARLDANLLPYDLDHIVLRLDGEVDLTLARNDESGAPAPLRLQGAAASFLASYIADGDGPARLDIAVNGFSGNLVDGANAPVALDAGLAEIHLRRAPDDASSTGLVARLESLTVGPGIEMVLGPAIERAYLEAHLQGLALPAMQSPGYVRAWAEAGGRAAIADAKLLWGGVDIEAKGALALDSTRRLMGELDAGVAGYDILLDRLFAARRIAANEKNILSGTFAIVAAMGGGRAAIPFNFARGKVFLGPVAIAELRPLF